MSIREILKEREEKRNQAASGGNLPEGVTRYVRLGQELKDGKTFVLLADPDNWYFYYTHEDGDFATRSTYLRKHTCLHSPRGVGEDFGKYEKPKKSVCISCAAGAKRKLYFMLPVFDPDYNEWRVLDLKEFHAVKLIGDYDKLEKAAKKFKKDYTLVGDAVVIGKTSDGKSYSMSSGELDDAVLEAAKKFIGQQTYVELANFRNTDDIMKILAEAKPNANLDDDVLEDLFDDSFDLNNKAKTKTGDPFADGPIDISDDDLPF